VIPNFWTVVYIIYIHIYIYIYIYKCVYICVYIYVYLYICIHIYILYTNIHNTHNTHTHTHTQYTQQKQNTYTQHTTHTQTMRTWDGDLLSSVLIPSWTFLSRAAAKGHAGRLTPAASLHQPAAAVPSGTRRSQLLCLMTRGWWDTEDGGGLTRNTGSLDRGPHGGGVVVVVVVVVVFIIDLIHSSRFLGVLSDNRIKNKVNRSSSQTTNKMWNHFVNKVIYV